MCADVITYVVSDNPWLGHKRVPMISQHCGTVCSYGLIDFTIGYACASARYRLVVDGRKLSNMRYAASAQLMPRATANEPAFNPAMQRAIFAGAKALW